MAMSGTYAQKSQLKAGFHWRRSQSRSRKSASNLVKIENPSRKWSHKLKGIGVGRIRTVPFSSDSAYDSDAYDPMKTRLSESQAEAEEPTNHNAAYNSNFRFPLDRRRFDSNYNSDSDSIASENQP